MVVIVVVEGNAGSAKVKCLVCKKPLVPSYADMMSVADGGGDNFACVTCAEQKMGRDWVKVQTNAKALSAYVACAGAGASCGNCGCAMAPPSSGSFAVVKLFDLPMYCRACARKTSGQESAVCDEKCACGGTDVLAHGRGFIRWVPGKGKVKA